ncbi:transporter substrate-binding domain-containing protein [Anaerobacillus sp. CMMVII]|uniref:ATP-binding protein n=1 Tax=Anaerobacillus sp. CMMVII TaxID=2755588 RepID=UPI0021B77D32|nr:transporter substrate-binding domain-containing protein [Anaerobacillus sp. CMMVII]MCT8139344.1 transporter substrate-binding domain-containing protein [Anaerobacillus sp. CMMVII]
MDTRIVLFVFFLSSMFFFEKNILVSAEQNQLRVAFDPYLSPIQFEENGVYRGFSIDVMNLIAELEGFQIDYQPLTKENAIKALQNGEIDVILSIHFLEQNALFMEFSNSLLTSSLGLLVSEGNYSIEGINDLSNKVTALQRGTVEYEFMRNIRRIKYNTTSNQFDALKLLANGRAVAFIGDHLVAEHYLKRLGLEEEFKFVASNLLPIEYTIAVQKGNYQLLNQINRSLRTIKSEGSYSEIYHEWFAQNDQQASERLLFITQLFGGLLGVSLLLFLLGIRWNRQLQNMIDKKTKDLSELNTTLKRQNEQTKNNYLFQKQILNSSPRGIVTCDKEKKVTTLNPKAMEIAGVSGKEIGKHYEEIKLLKDLLSDRIESVLQKGEKYLVEETFWYLEDREYFLRYYIYPQYDYEQKITGLILTFEDGTEDRKLKQQIFEQEKNQALSRVVAGIAHEIRNPLTSIKTFVELIPKKIENKRFQDEISTYLPVEINRINQLIEGLIDYARPRSFNKEIVDAAQVVNECVILFDRTVENKGFTLSSLVQDDLFIEADRNQLKQIVINLIINSIDAMTSKEQGNLVIEIKAFTRENDVIIEIIDQGIGMNNEEIERIFEPFYTTKPKGTGLGLAIAQQYMKENNGSLLIKSEKGFGTTMTLKFSKKGETTHGENLNY